MKQIFSILLLESYASIAPSWMINMIKEYNGNPYGQLVAMAKLAQHDGVIKGILLHQGESNTNDTTWPGKVKIVYDNLIKDLNLEHSFRAFAGGRSCKCRSGWCLCKYE